MKRLLTIILLHSIAGQLHSQEVSRISGRVLDALTREPVVAATVSTVLEGRKVGASTDTLGRFGLSFPTSRSTLTINCIGYRTWINQVAPRATELLILLEPADNLLSGVVVTGTMKEVMKEVSPIPVEVYTPRFFQKSASPSFFEAVGMINGVRPQLNCNVCNTGDIHINGMEGPYTMITIDGMPIVSGLATVYGLSGIPNGIVERIEIVKGPASTLYGSEAVGGLINIITKSPLTAPRLYADVFGTSIGELNAEVAFSAAKKRVSTLLGLNYFHFDHLLDINGDYFTDVAQQDRVSIFNKWTLTDRHDRPASLALRYVHEDRWGGQLNWAPRWRGTDSVYGESIYTNRFELLGRQPLPFGHPVTLDYSYNV
ncbi:MAG: TonB-dependent receptor plug domain-containing protein, partial [Saprospiraceae bacterium]